LGRGSLGTRLDSGYGAPDFAWFALIGYHAPIEDSGRELARRAQCASFANASRATAATPTTNGIPDDVDLCPSVPEDHQEPDPSDGCPVPPDRDHDGSRRLRQMSRRAEDKDGIQDMDGCPEVDYDSDGVPDVSDACPREPGSPSTDPKQNGLPAIHQAASPDPPKSRS